MNAPTATIAKAAGFFSPDPWQVIVTLPEGYSFRHVNPYDPPSAWCVGFDTKKAAAAARPRMLATVQQRMQGQLVTGRFSSAPAVIKGAT